ncbi:MAG: energy transducer TonB [Acidobacteriota bacterium]|nr:energy transducer TonB [Acidobacteriota bacterium]
MFKRVSVLLFLCLVSFCVVAEAQRQPQTRQRQPGINKPLKILSRPHAAYTDAARQNNIQGTVQVRITFLPDGTIGQVSDVARNHENLRKFGLVRAAMEAARKVKFEPEIRNGKPVKATKIMEYSFTLF